MKLTNSFANMTISLIKNNENDSVWYSTRVLKYFHPSIFHCYYAGKETVISFTKYLSITSWKDILYNVIYKTGYMIDQGRIIYQMIRLGTYLDREIYVIARSLGTFINIIL